ncbi:TVP38/TMEM64 family protein [Oculatella sp. LEGE 06141]|uniref:TVP38/TMEM64 family protein n=1 Tax=Oculatella sp. LEGE 06141 TaxID=1828648 RepID=UPI0018828958|nr:TVP38/TMEM64 family protein [Oculatella sp. LEGE 06141]MBE9180471.1 TVP38/TMEM64 family protein [Oculatella sp. LEGE 06141]
MKRGILFLTLACIAATIPALHLLGGIDPEQLQILLRRAGVWAPIIYVVVYVIATALVLPSTVLNLTGGAIFGPWLGTLWTSVAAVVAAIVTFTFTRTFGRHWVSQKLAGRWQAMDAEIQQGGVFYIFAVRLLPIIPYGIVNFTAGLTSVRLRDYLIGTILGTVPGVLPFVLLGSSGLTVLQTGDVIPLMAALGLIGTLVGGATWYRRRRADPRRALHQQEQAANPIEPEQK